MQNDGFVPNNYWQKSKIISRLKNKRNTSHDGVSNEIINGCWPVIEPYLVELFKKYPNEENFPDQMKSAKEVPSFEKSNKLQAENYRSIGLLSSVSEVFGSQICKRMTFFHKVTTCGKTQMVFWKNQPGINALIGVTEYIREQLDKKSKGHLCFLDLKRAFDTIGQNILLCKLERYGFWGKILSLNEHYLANRSQFVTLNGKFHLWDKNRKRSTRLSNWRIPICNIHQWSARCLRQCKIDTFCWWYILV